MIHLQPEAGVPPSLIEPQITMPTPPWAPFENPLSLQEDALVATHHDDQPSPGDDPLQLESETHPDSFNPISVTPQAASPPPTDSEN